MQMKKMRKLNQTSRSSYSVLIPPDWIRDLGWRKKQKLVLHKRGKELLIKDWKPSSKIS
jgi:phosphate uptake regulator